MLLSMLLIFFLSIAMVSAASDLSADNSISSPEDLKTDLISTSNEEILNEDADALTVSAEEDDFNEDDGPLSVSAEDDIFNEDTDALSENQNKNLSENSDDYILNDDPDDVEIIVNCPAIVDENR